MSADGDGPVRRESGVDLRAAAGIQVGDHSVQHNHYRAPAATAAVLLVGVLGLVAVTCEPIRGALSGADGLTLAVADKDEDHPCGQPEGWAVPDPAALPPDASEARTKPAGYQLWVRQHGGIPAGRSTKVITLRGPQGAALVIDDIQVTVTARRPPVEGTDVQPDCGGAPPQMMYVEVDLDRLTPGEPTSLRDFQPTATPTRPPNGPGVATLPFTVTETDIARIELTAGTNAWDNDWRATVTWTNGSEQGQTEVPAAGEPAFRLTKDLTRP